MKNKRFPALPIFLCIIFVFFAVSNFNRPAFAESNAAGVVDFRNKEVSLRRPAERIVCLIESALSGLYMLDAEQRVVGISTNVYEGNVFPYYAAMDERIEKRSLPAPGNWDFVNIEMVVGLRPDLVVVWSHQKESIASLEEKGIPVYGVFIRSFADVQKEIRDLGRLTGTSRRAEELVALAASEMESVRTGTSKVAPEKRAKVYYMWAQGELETSGKNSTVQELIESAGAENAAGHIDQEHLVVNMENVLSWNPDVIVMWNDDRREPSDILEKPVWRSVSAVENRRVHEFPDVFSCDLWTLKYVHPVRLTARWCYPEQFKGDDLPGEKARLFKKLYGDKLDLDKVGRLSTINNR
jgi:iron complex transport system substrate-binding protein